ncbi:MAG TPA: universal stress protein [Rubrobacteraceae bacterium]|nr:universal stress protein [Rubrobacteraceae bacterium]
MSALPEKVLLATDGSEDAALAAQAAGGLCAKTGAELHIVHALRLSAARPYPAPPYFSEGVVDALERDSRRLLEREVGRVEGEGARDVQAHLRMGTPIDVVLETAEEVGAGLVVMGSRGLGPIKRLLLGSVCEGVVHHAAFPVLVVRGGDGSWPPQRIVFGDDGSEAAKEAVELAALIGRLSGAGGLLVRAYPEMPETDLEGRGWDARLVNDELRREEWKLEERAGEVSRLLGVRPKVRVAVGDPAVCLLEAAEGDSTPERTLVAVGSRGLGAVGRVRLGSVSTNVLRAARGPVLVYPERRN